jgi:hypothetical protein
MADLKYDPRLMIAAGGSREDRKLDRFDLVSAAPHAQWWEREDPYWEEWLFGSQPQFYARYETIRRQVATNDVLLHRVDDFDSPDNRQYRKSWKSTMTAEKTLRALSLMAGMHHVNSKQVVAWVGYHPTSIFRVLRPLFDFGLTERGVYTMEAKHAGRLAQLHALHDGPRLRRWFKERELLDTQHGEQVLRQVLDHRPVEAKYANPGSVFVRHNLLAVEVLLRTLEVNPAFTDVSGERNSRLRSLTGGNRDMPSMPADGSLWRHDGLRVMIEVVSSRDIDHMRKKMRRWAQTFAAHPLNETGTVLVFLNAHKDRHGAVATALRKAHAEIISDGLTLESGRHATSDEILRARQQIHVASWEDWYPAHGEMSVLGADLVTAATSNGRDWFAVSLASTEEVPYGGRVYTSPSSRGTLLTPSWSGAFPFNSYDPDVRYGRTNDSEDRQRKKAQMAHRRAVARADRLRRELEQATADLQAANELVESSADIDDNEFVDVLTELT